MLHDIMKKPTYNFTSQSQCLRYEEEEVLIFILQTVPRGQQLHHWEVLVYETVRLSKFFPPESLTDYLHFIASEFE